MPSFDVVSKVDMQEVKNALDQVRREIETRYDFRNSKSSVDLKEEVSIAILADDNQKLKAIQELLSQKMAKRGISPKSLDFKDSEKAGGDMLRQEILIKQGLKDEDLKRLNKLIKEQKFKANSQIQGDQLRISGKKRDDLQEIIAFLRANVTDIVLQYVNFRD